MKKLLILFILGFGAIAYAEGDSKPLVLPDFSGLEKAVSNIRVSGSCKTADDKEYKPGEPGFESCMRRSGRASSSTTRQDQINRDFHEQQK